jgi:capsule polysaccharide export protein KpsE/RkpR
MSSVIEQATITSEAETANSAGAAYLPTLTMLWQCRRFLAKCAVSGLVMATILAFVIPKQYKSTVQLMPPDSPAASVGWMATVAGTMPSFLSNAAGGMLGNRSPNAMFLGILNSRTIQDNLIDRFDLRREYHLTRYLDARKRLAAHTVIDDDRKTGNLSITVVDHDPQRARDLAAGYVDELDKLVATVSTSSARRERVFLEQRLKSIKEELDASSRDLSQFSSRNATFDPLSAQAKSMLDAAGKLQGELTAAESELRGLETIYSDDNVRVRSLRARTEELRRQLRKLSGSSSENGSELNSGELYPSVRKLPLLTAAYNDLYRRAKVQETVFEILTRQYEAAKVQEAKEIPTVKVLDSADVPEKKSYPPRLLIMVLGMMISFVVGVAWIIGEGIWKGVDERDPRKVFLTDVVSTILRRVRRAKVPLFKTEGQTGLK